MKNLTKSENFFAKLAVIHVRNHKEEFWLSVSQGFSNIIDEIRNFKTVMIKWRCGYQFDD